MAIANVDRIHHTEKMSRLDMEVTSMLGAVQALIGIRLLILNIQKRARVEIASSFQHLICWFSRFCSVYGVRTIGKRKVAHVTCTNPPLPGDHPPTCSVWVSETCDVTGYDLWESVCHLPI